MRRTPSARHTSDAVSPPESTSAVAAPAASPTSSRTRSTDICRTGRLRTACSARPNASRWRCCSTVTGWSEPMQKRTEDARWGAGRGPADPPHGNVRASAEARPAEPAQRIRRFDPRPAEAIVSKSRSHAASTEMKRAPASRAAETALGCTCAQGSKPRHAARSMASGTMCGSFGDL